MTDKHIKIERLEVGSLKTNCYLIFADKKRKCLIIDPGDEADFIENSIFRLDLNPVAVLATHGHFDHLLAVNELKEAYQIPFLAGRSDEFLIAKMKNNAKYFLKREIFEKVPKIDKYLEDVDEITLEPKIGFQVISTPGHTPGSYCFLNTKEKIVLDGDLIFEQGFVGRTDFSYSSEDALKSSLQKIRQTALNFRFYPGHGESFILNKKI